MKISEIWLKTATAARVLGVTPRALRKQIAKGRFVVQSTGGHGGACQKQYEIALSSLPPEARRRYWELNQDSDLVPDNRECQEESTKRLSHAEMLDRLGEDEYRRVMDEAWRKLAIVEEYLAAKELPYPEGRIEQIKVEHGVADRTLRRWALRYREEGLDGLIHQKHREAVANRRILPKLRAYAVSLYLQRHKPTAAWVYEQVCQKAEKMCVPAPSRATVYRILKEDILPGDLVLGREGPDAWRKKIMPKTRRDYSDLARYEILVGDGHTFNLFINYNGRAIRAKLSMWQDCRTRAIAGWCVAVHDNSTTIGLALRHAILPKPNSPIQGVPLEIYVDHGKDYLSKQMAGVCARLGIEIRPCTPHTPWAKLIERTFGVLDSRWLRHLPGWCGNSPENRPEGFDEKKLLAAGKLLAMEQLVAEFNRIVDEYNRRVHSETGKAPIELFGELPPVRPEMPDPRALDILMMRIAEVKVYADGIRRWNYRYWDDALVPVVGETVTIHYDPNRLGELLVIHRGRALCVAKSAEALSMRASEEQVRDHQRKQKRARKFFQERLDAWQELASEDEPKTPATPAAIPGANAEAGRPAVPLITGLEQAAKLRDKDAVQGDDQDLPARRDRAREFLLDRGRQVLKKIKEG